MNDKSDIEVIQAAIEHIGQAAAAAPNATRKRMLQGKIDDERLLLIHTLAKRLERIRDRRAPFDGVEVTFYRSETDNVQVIHIDTTFETGRIRVNLNDGPALYDGDPETDPVDDGTIHAAVISQLEADLGSNSPEFWSAEAWINDYPDEFWEQFAEPMISAIKERFS